MKPQSESVIIPTPFFFIFPFHELWMKKWHGKWSRYHYSLGMSYGPTNDGLCLSWKYQKMTIRVRWVGQSTEHHSCPRTLLSLLSASVVSVVFCTCTLSLLTSTRFSPLLVSILRLSPPSPGKHSWDHLTLKNSFNSPAQNFSYFLLKLSILDGERGEGSRFPCCVFLIFATLMSTREREKSLQAKDLSQSVDNETTKKTKKRKIER